MIRQGELYTADSPDIGGRRPVVIVSRDSLNRGTHVLIVPFTTARFAQRWQSPSCVPFRTGEFGLNADCVAQCDALNRISVGELVSGPTDELDDLVMRNVINAIGKRHRRRLRAGVGTPARAR